MVFVKLSNSVSTSAFLNLDARLRENSGSFMYSFSKRCFSICKWIKWFSNVSVLLSSELSKMSAKFESGIVALFCFLRLERRSEIGIDFLLLTFISTGSGCSSSADFSALRDSISLLRWWSC